MLKQLSSQSQRAFQGLKVRRVGTFGALFEKEKLRYLSFDEVPFEEISQKMGSVTDHLSRRLSDIQCGKISRCLLENLKFAFEGSEMEVLKVATAAVLNPQTLCLSIRNLAHTKAIVQSIKSKCPDLIISCCSPDTLTLSSPAMTIEMREEAGKRVQKFLEPAKIDIRQIRNSFMAKYRKCLKLDDGRLFEKELARLHDNAVKHAEGKIEEKRKQLMN